MFIIYDIALIIFAVFYLPYFIVKRKYHRDMWMRLGALPKKVMKALGGEKTIWVHAVSVGEVMAAKPLLDELHKEFPNKKIVISTVTKTGNRIARNIAKPSDIVIYFPLDLNLVVRSIVSKINPEIFILLETEIWPNTIRIISGRGIPIIIVNGRISPRSFERYKFVKPFLKEILKRINMFCMQSPLDAARIVELGAPKYKVRTTGNMKFDASLVKELFSEREMLIKKAFNLTDGQKLVVAGSTHKGEESVFLRTFKTLKEAFPKTRLLIAPRHIDRTHEIESLAREHGFKPARLSQLSIADMGTNSDLLILDTLGDLKTAYSLADLVFVGGSLVPGGGHNMIEPASFSKPILFGPHTFNFQDIADLFVIKGAAVQVNNEKELIVSLRNLLLDSHESIAMGHRAKRLVEENSGATVRNMAFINELLIRKGET